MKQAVEDQLAGGCYTRTEVEVGRGYRDSGYLRVDVKYHKNSRYFLVECETKPNIKRLIEKALKRKTIQYRTTYLLVVPHEETPKHDWGLLRGSFDKIYSYSNGELRQLYDLRRLGWLQDAALNLAMPVVRSWRLMCWRNDIRMLMSVNWKPTICLRCLLMALPGGRTCNERYCPLHPWRWYQAWDMGRYFYIPHIENTNIFTALWSRVRPSD
jgi:hypothetical protein